jgi:YVTN family beta-propeller protein
MSFQNRTPINAACWVAVWSIAFWGIQCVGLAAERTGDATGRLADAVDRSPVDLVLTPDERLLITANQTSSTLSLVDVATGRVVHETRCGKHPAAVAITADGKRVLVSCAYAGTVEIYDVTPAGLNQSASIHVGFYPYGIAITADGRRAYVAQADAAAVAEIDLAAGRVLRKIDVGRWPRQVALSADSRMLAVATSGDQTVSIVDTAAGKLSFQHRTGGGLNIGQLQIDRSGQYVYFPWIIYRQFPITAQNIRLGWVLASRIARAQLAENAYREAISLDVPGVAVGDPHGLALTPDETWMACTASGTHELLVYRLAEQKFMSVGGPGDLGDPRVYRDDQKFFRVPLGGRPMNLRPSRDSRRMFVANYLSSAVQVVDLERREVVQTVDLGHAAEPSLARQGEAIFYDARRSLDQWYSCASCHYEGGINAVPMDTRNDGTDKTFKTVTALHNATHTAPWTWHGWQKDLGSAMRKSLADTMLGLPPNEHDVEAMVAFLGQLEPPPNPYAAAAVDDPALGASIERGRAVFHSAKAACATCHSGKYFTDGQVHDVGLGSEKDAYRGFNTPSLVGAFRRVRLLHDGRARTLEEVLTGDHNPAQVTGQGELSADELRDLVAYLKTL